MERLNHPYYKETSGLYKYDYQAEPKYEGYCMDDYIGAFIVWIILSVIILFIGIFTWFLEYDVGVEMGSITKAAEAMGYTQSAVSRMVADLEDEWNLNLLRRSRGGLALSSDGLMLLPYIKDLCSHYEALQEQANSLKGLETGFIRIGSCSSFSTQCLPSILKNFEQRYPRIVFQLQNMEYSETEEALCAGEIDCGFISAPYSPELDVTVLLRDRMLAVLPPDHPLADAPSYPLKRFSGERIIKLTDEANNEVSKVFAQLNSMLDTPVTAYCDVNDDCWGQTPHNSH